MIAYLVRHGHIRKSADDPSISRKGVKQAAAVGAFLRDKRLTCVYSSPLRRALETATVIAQALASDGEAVPLLVEPRLRERMNWGDVPGQTWNDFVTEWERADQDRHYIPPGGLSSHQAAANMTAFLAELAARAPGSAFAIVAHGGIISDYLLDALPPGELSSHHPEWAAIQGDVISHCSVTTIRYVGLTPHLEGLAVVVGPGVVKGQGR